MGTEIKSVDSQRLQLRR